MKTQEAGKFIIIVIDGLGIGAMDDVAIVRPKDIDSNTALNIITRHSDIRIPNLERLGLMNAIGKEFEHHQFSDTANWGVCNLAHQGADSFLGHQEIVGTLPKKPLIEPFNHKIDLTEQALAQAGYCVRKVGAETEPKILVVNDCVTVGDNLETDYGQVYNVTACLDLISFDELKKIAYVVRDCAKVSRVITFGGEEITLNDLLNAKRTVNNEIAGVDAPLSGVYRKGYKVIHLGFGIDKNVQIPTILEQENIDVCLIGKAADIIQSNSPNLIYGSDTEFLLNKLLDESAKMTKGLIIINIQETDLAGHSEDSMWYSQLLELIDKKLATLINSFNSNDILVVMADHGDDPTVGHSHHTREKVPLLIYKSGLSNKKMGVRSTLSDVGATAAEYFDVKMPQNGVSFLSELMS